MSTARRQFAADPLSGENGPAFPPVPDPRSAQPPGTPELTVDVQGRAHLARAASDAAAYIARHNDWSDSIDDQGVMMPIWLVVTTYRHADGTPDGVALVTADGSSRLTAAHKAIREGTGSLMNFSAAEVPYRGDDDAKFRADLRRMADWVENGPVDEARAAALRNVVVPAFLIVGFDSERPNVTFHAAVKSLALGVAHAKVLACRDNGASMAARYGVPYRACDRMLGILHAVTDAVAAWKQADINHNGRDTDDDPARGDAEYAA